ncbi:MAG: AAA family ATPase [Treponema sp.]|nr:AAA family ATPase [Treponema sp.]
MNLNKYELSPEDIVFTISPPELSENTDSDATIIGQSRAMKALSLGLGIHAKGYNIYIQGSPGTGRRTALLKALTNYTASQANLQDFIYVPNYAVPTEPHIIQLPAGTGRLFKQKLHDFIEEMKRLVKLHRESDAFKNKKSNLVSLMEQQENKTLSAFESEAASLGFQIVQINEGESQSTDLVPLRDGVPISFEDLQAQVASGTLSAAEWNTLRETYYALIDRMKGLFDSLKRERMDLDRKIQELSKEMLRPQIHSQIEKLSDEFPYSAITAWLHTLEEDIIGHLPLFYAERLEKEAQRSHSHPSALIRYGANIIVDRSGISSPPVIFENRPTLTNLVGTIEPPGSVTEELRSAYLRIRAGSLIKAAGGILVLRAEDIVQDEEAWPYLKRVLQTGIVEIQCPPNPIASPLIIKPEPIELYVKVVLIGEESTYDILYQTDPDFQKLFKVCAEFDSTMNRNEHSQQRYAAFLHKIVQEEGLLPLEASGVSAVLEWSVRDAEHRQKLSTRFSRVVDLLREATWYAREHQLSEISAEVIQKTLELRSYLHRLPEETIQSMILADEIIIQFSGTAIGKINGLAVHDRGYYSYGIPVVVSAQVAPGDGGVINIEGESGLSGEIFDKAVLILSGYLRSRYARTFPLSITASVCFEQMYTPIDGDSATAAQLCAIISAISGIPLRQDLAITGSVNQLGDMQPVGGVSEKIEGFHSICSKRGLTGTQGVLIPRRNMNNLILSALVQKDIQAGLFHLYAVNTIDEALEVFMGKPAGFADEDGVFPSDTINGIVSRELKRMATIIKRYET